MKLKAQQCAPAGDPKCYTFLSRNPVQVPFFIFFLNLALPRHSAATTTKSNTHVYIHTHINKNVSVKNVSELKGDKDKSKTF